MKKTASKKPQLKVSNQQRKRKYKLKKKSEPVIRQTAVVASAPVVMSNSVPVEVPPSMRGVLYTDLDPCTKHYASALVDPIGTPAGACIPRLVPIQSHKFRTLSRGSFTTGTTGVGGIAVWPLRMLTRDYATVSNIQPRAWVATGPTYNRTDFDFLDSPVVDSVARTDLRFGIAQQSVYSGAQLAGGTGLSAALVSCGIRVWYSDTVLNKKGNFTVWRNSAATASLPNNGDDQASLLASMQAKFVPVDCPGSQVSVAYNPLLSLDLEPVEEPYSGNAFGVYDDRGIASRLAFGVFVNDAAPVQTFSFELVAHFEVMGKNVPVTPSHSDAQGTGKVISANTDYKHSIFETAQKTLENLVGGYGRSYSTIGLPKNVRGAGW